MGSRLHGADTYMVQTQGGAHVGVRDVACVAASCFVFAARVCYICDLAAEGKQDIIFGAIKLLGCNKQAAADFLGSLIGCGRTALAHFCMLHLHQVRLSVQVCQRAGVSKG